MSVYVITGVSKGLGFEFLKQISAEPSNLVIGLVRDTAATERKIAAEIGPRPANVHILHGDLADYASLKQAAADTAAIVGDRGVDYLVASGAYVSQLDEFGPIGELDADPAALDAVMAQLTQTNVTGNIHLFHLFLPLVRRGRAKKVVAISSGMADLDLVNRFEVEVGALYSASKAALNLIVAKFSAQYKREGILFLSISPGLVDVGKNKEVTPEQQKGLESLGAKLAEYAPHFTGPITPEESVRLVRGVWEKASVEGGYAGDFISHLGTKQWV